MKTNNLRERTKNSLPGNRTLSLVAVLLFGGIMAGLLLRSQAGGADIISLAGDGTTCVNGNGSLSVESESSNKANLQVCELEPGDRYWPNNYTLSSGTYDQLFSRDVAAYVMAVRGYSRVETCFYLTAVGENATVDLRLFGNRETGRAEGVKIRTGRYRAHCYRNDVAHSLQDVTNASLHNVVNGKVRLSSITLKGLKSNQDLEASAISFASSSEVCKTGGGSNLDETEDNLKRGFNVCRLDSNDTYWPDNYTLLPNGDVESQYGFEDVIDHLITQQHTVASSCFNVRAINGPAVIDVRALGDRSGNFVHNNVSVAEGEYQQLCYTNEFESGDVGNASIRRVVSGTILLSSIEVIGSDIAPPNVTFITVCRDGELVQIRDIERLDSDSDPPCNAVDPNAYYVDKNNPNASNNNPGTATQPWKTIVYGASQLRAGDTLYVKAGTYRDGKVVLNRSGSANEPITLAAYPGQERQVIIDGSYIETNGASHLVIRGFKIQNGTYGVRVNGPVDNTAPPAENIIIEDNWTFQTVSTGISVWGVNGGREPGDYNNVRDVKVLRNKVEDCVTTGYNECIVAANGVVNIEVAYNEVTNPNSSGATGGEGIDFKEGVDGGKIHHNYLHNMIKNAIYMDGGGFWTERSGLSRTFVRNIEIYSNHIVNIKGAGIVIVNEGPADSSNFKIYNNFVEKTTRHGISVYDHYGGSGVSTIDGVYIVNNTVVNSGQEGANGWWSGIGIVHPTARNIVVRNNIAWGNAASDITSTNSSYVQDNNLCRNSFCEIRTSPLFVSSTDFRLQPSSPAINTGSSSRAPSFDYDGISRPQGSGFDMGAFEWQ